MLVLQNVGDAAREGRARLITHAHDAGHGERFMPVLSGILAELNGCKIRDLDQRQ